MEWQIQPNITILFYFVGQSYINDIEIIPNKSSIVNKEIELQSLPDGDAAT